MITPVVMRPTRTTCASVSLGPETLDYINGDERGTAIEGRRHTAHERRRQAGGNQTAHAYRDQILDQQRQHGVVVGTTGAGHVSQMDRPFLPKHIADDPGKHHEKDRRELQEAGKQRAVLPILQGVRAEHALHVGLVRTPIPDTEDGIAEHNRQPGELAEMSLAHSITGCNMWSCPGATACRKAARSCTPTPGSARTAMMVMRVAPPSSRTTWILSVITTAFSPPRAA